MKLSRGMTVYVTVETGNPEAWIDCLAIVRGIEFFLGKRKDQPAQAVKLNRRENIFEQSKKIVDRNHFTA